MARGCTKKYTAMASEIRAPSQIGPVGLMPYNIVPTTGPKIMPTTGAADAHRPEPHEALDGFALAQRLRQPGAAGVESLADG